MAFWRRDTAPWACPGVGPANREISPWMKFAHLSAWTCTRPLSPFAVADAGRNGEVRHVGAIENTPTAIGKLARSLIRRHGVPEFVYEAGSCGYKAPIAVW